MNVNLATGKNFVSLADGASSVRYEVLSIGKVQGAQVVKKSGALKTSPCHLCWLGLVLFSVMIQ
jgi:hypothetical protein